ncbi:hypothetical protein DHEL01_v204902 [Diaporthe helianthi]|uniref:Uncharacterized protein n=1 Tax=Diaporthe helianthi TaxID=158607 RepID=A0A2P5I2H1_DIAHE|nr:hypothetical protein DHEL01_v204902 [Diaporthe helianthi]
MIVSNFHKVRLIISGAAGVGAVIAASLPRCLAATKRLVDRARPLVWPTLSSGSPPIHHPTYYFSLQVSKQPTYPVRIAPLSFAPVGVEAASTTHTRLVMTAACLGFDGQASPQRRRSPYRCHITALTTCSTGQGEYDE